MRKGGWSWLDKVTWWDATHPENSSKEIIAANRSSVDVVKAKMEKNTVRAHRPAN